MRPLITTEPYRTGRTHTAAVVFLLFLNIALLALGALLSLAEIASGEAARDPTVESDLTALDLLVLGLVLVRLPVFIATVVVFCMWLYRSYRNLSALGNPKPALQHSAGWAVGSFFVPFANLFIPYRAVRETWAKSDPTVIDETYVAPVEPPAPVQMKLWWGFWLVSNFVDNASFRVYMRAETGTAMLVGTWLDMAGDTLSLVAAVCAIWVVREIGRRQEERSRRVAYTSTAPPPPPLFNTPRLST